MEWINRNFFLRDVISLGPMNIKPEIIQILTQGKLNTFSAPDINILTSKVLLNHLACCLHFNYKHLVLFLFVLFRLLIHYLFYNCVCIRVVYSLLPSQWNGGIRPQSFPDPMREISLPLDELMVRAADASVSPLQPPPSLLDGFPPRYKRVLGLEVH